MRTAILGGGSWGTAFAIHLVRCGHAATLWTRSPEAARTLADQRMNPVYLPGIELPDELAVTHRCSHALANADTVFFAVPSFAVRETARACAPSLAAEVPLVHLAKGLEPCSGLRVSQILEQELPGHPLFALSGPSHAEEVAAGQPTAVVLAGRPTSLGKELQEQLMAPVFRVYLARDLLGVEYCGVVKNVLAVGAGISDGLGYGDNTRAALVTRGLAELVRFGTALGAQQETFYGLAGLGDLVVTATSDLSRNRQVGIRLGRGERRSAIIADMRMVAEGLHAAATLWERAQHHHVDMPITEAVYRIAYLDESPLHHMRNLMQRPPKWEQP